MKKLLCILLILCCAKLQAQTFVGGRDIHIKVTPLKNTKVYIGGYYGTMQAIFDSTMLNDKSEGVFTGPSRLTGGIYFIVTDKYVILPFEFLMDDVQQFSIAVDTLNGSKPVITGSEENNLNQVLTQFGTTQKKLQDQLREDYSKAKTKKDSARIDAEYIKSQKATVRFQDSLINKHPNTLLASLLGSLKRPEVPAIPVVNGKADSLYPYHFVKGHYWDDVNFGDDRLLHTPFFERKINEYFTNYISIEADSIIKEVNYIMLSAKGSKEMYPYLLNKFTKEYMNPKYMGQDKVFVFLFENFYAKGDSSLLDEANKKIVFDRAYKLMANQIGLPAAPINFPDTSGRIIPLYSLTNPFTVVVFWDPTCGHCKIELPRLDSMHRAKWKAMNIGLYAVNVNEDETSSWKKFIADNKLSGWIHTHETKAIRLQNERANIMNFRQAYDVYKTPTLYLLDKEKHIIAKQLTMEQFDELIKLKTAK